MKKALVTVLVLAALTGGILLLARYERYEWSTESPAALGEFEAGLEAYDKLYRPDAAAHFEKALVLDPGFTVARLFLLRSLSDTRGSATRRAELLESLREADLDHLNDRERALISIFLANAGDERGKAAEILESYLARHPDDPFLLELQCRREDTMSQPGKSEACYQRLSEIDPNRLQAQNMLGYLAFYRGDFKAAEERFELYGYLAPDQANPHDSLGELLMVTGRYEEAETQFRQAVEIKPDFCDSWINLVNLGVLRRDATAAAKVVDEMDAADGCPPARTAAQRCRGELWNLAFAGRWEDLHAAGQADCPPDPWDPDSSILAVRAAFEVGRPEDAEKVVEGVSGWVRRVEQSEPEKNPFVLLLAGLTASGEGDWQRADERLSAADERNQWGGSMGLGKLYLRFEWSAALEAAGEHDKAAGLLASVAAVNPRFVASPPIAPLHPLPALPPAAVEETR